MSPADHRVTRLLNDLHRGDPGASEKLLPLVYEELRGLARSRLARERHGHAQQPTSLVHDVYLRLVGDRAMTWDGRAHFFAAAAEAMRRILIEQARRRARVRHGGERRRVTFEEDGGRVEPPSAEIFAVNDALKRLEALDASMAHVVKLRYFAGLTVEETAQALATSPRSINRAWIAARAWLHREISRQPPQDG